MQLLLKAATAARHWHKLHNCWHFQPYGCIQAIVVRQLKRAYLLIKTTRHFYDFHCDPNGPLSHERPTTGSKLSSQQKAAQGHIHRKCSGWVEYQQFKRGDRM
jgi:hypothetical protein